MAELEKIQRYIDRTGKKFPDGTPYQMRLGDMLKLAHVAEGDLIGTICLAFNYGRAKGYRAAKAEDRTCKN